MLALNGRLDKRPEHELLRALAIQAIGARSGVRDGPSCFSLTFLIPQAHS